MKKYPWENVWIILSSPAFFSLAMRTTASVLCQPGLEPVQNCWHWHSVPSDTLLRLHINQVSLSHSCWWIDLALLLESREVFRIQTHKSRDLSLRLFLAFVDLLSITLSPQLTGAPHGRMRGDPPNTPHHGLVNCQGAFSLGSGREGWYKTASLY